MGEGILISYVVNQQNNFSIFFFHFHKIQKRYVKNYHCWHINICLCALSKIVPTNKFEAIVFTTVYSIHVQLYI